MNDGSAPVLLGSRILQELHEKSPPDRLTLKWVLDHVQTQSFGLVLVLLAVAGAAPGVCVFAGLLMALMALQIIIGRRSPFFPNFIANYPLSTRHLEFAVKRAIPLLRILEKGIYPRWPEGVSALRRLFGLIVLILSLQLVLIPIPFSNVVPALVILLMSLAYLEGDGIALGLAMTASVATAIFAGTMARDFLLPPIG